MSQIKFYLPSEGLFYGYCHKAIHYCSWDHHSQRIIYLEESEYIEKQNSLETISATSLDDMTLNVEPTQSTDDPNIGCK